jgi:hypothetical protein
MAAPTRYLELRCGGCLWHEVCGPAEMVGWLRKAGKIRQGKAMEPEILYEVFRSAASQFACRQCGRTGLSVSNAADEIGEWPGMPTCAKCGRPIDKERIEALPRTTVCAACQRDSEHGVPKPDRDCCPRCGAPLEVRAIPQGNRTRYVLACSANPPCPL